MYSVADRTIFSFLGANSREEIHSFVRGYDTAQNSFGLR